MQEPYHIDSQPANMCTRLVSCIFRQRALCKPRRSYYIGICLLGSKYMMKGISDVCYVRNTIASHDSSCPPPLHVSQLLRRGCLHATPLHYRSQEVDPYHPIHAYYITCTKIKIQSSCEIEDFVETHLCKLCVILRSRVLRVVCPH